MRCLDDAVTPLVPACFFSSYVVDRKPPKKPCLSVENKAKNTCYGVSSFPGSGRVVNSNFLSSVLVPRYLVMVHYLFLRWFLLFAYLSVAKGQAL
jgi:hypothetical protein